MRLPFRFFASPRRLLGALLLAGGVATGMADAIAREPGGRHPRFAMGQGERIDARSEMRAARQAERRGAMRSYRPPEVPMQRMPAPELPRQFVPSQPPGGGLDRAGRPGRLTPDERRALRQQINEAGRDVYRPNGWR